MVVSHSRYKLTPRVFLTARLTPSSIFGDTTQPEPGCFLIDKYEEAGLTLAEVLPAGVEFYLVDAPNLPEWVKTAWDGIDTIVGDNSGVVIYRHTDTQEIGCRAFLELIGDQPVAVPGFGDVGYQTDRYLNPASVARHDRPYMVRTTVFENVDVPLTMPTKPPSRH